MRARALLLFALANASCGLWWRAPAEEKGDQIKIPHATHARAKVDCLVCHESIYDAPTMEGRFLPPEKTCLGCHKKEKETGNCAFCHTNVKRAADYPKRDTHLQLSHAAHIERTKEQCSVCHTALPAPVRTADTVVPMSACLKCHEHKQQFNEGRCGVCHTDLKRYRLQPVSAFSHQGNFVREHGRVARSSGETCATCHEQTHCADCHARTVSTRIEVKLPEHVGADFIHRNDFLGRHAVEAQADSPSCRRCHGTSFCDNCHRVQNLTPFGSNPRNPHPPGWSFPGSAVFHGPAARRDIASCAACHDQGARSVCVDCHRSGGIGGNPHPPGWNRSRSEISGNNMCLTCHL
jgi:hypothetical protein